MRKLLAAAIAMVERDTRVVANLVSRVGRAALLEPVPTTTLADLLVGRAGTPAVAVLRDGGPAATAVRLRLAGACSEIRYAMSSSKCR